MNNGKSCILLIDRHTEWLNFAVEVLTQAGYKVFTANEFSEAVEHWQDQPFDLVLVGLDQAESHLNELSGMAKNQTSPKRVVVMFPIRQTYDRMRIVFKAGAYDVIDKPYNADALLRTVSELIANSQKINGILENSY
jgi:DNA-binding NtrC family response regulator